MMFGYVTCRTHYCKPEQKVQSGIRAGPLAFRVPYPRNLKKAQDMRSRARDTAICRIKLQIPINKRT